MRRIPLALAVLALSAALAPLASAQTLLVDRVQQESAMTLPSRGMSMAEVERRFGAPTERLGDAGGQKRQWPTIHRWAYPNFIVYFERNRVIDAVAIKADADEIGPKPASR